MPYKCSCRKNDFLCTACKCDVNYCSNYGLENYSWGVEDVEDDDEEKDTLFDI